MSQDEIVEMARQAGFLINELHCSPPILSFSGQENSMETFAKLVAAKEEARYMQLFLDPENQPTQFGTATQEYRDREILEEREECAKICEERISYWQRDDIRRDEDGQCSAAIRARGEA